MDTIARTIQFGWDVVVSRDDFDALNLTTNTIGVAGAEFVSQDRVKLSTQSEDQFNRWCATLTNAKRKFEIVKPGVR